MFILLITFSPHSHQVFFNLPTGLLPTLFLTIWLSLLSSWWSQYTSVYNSSTHSSHLLLMCPINLNILQGSTLCLAVTLFYCPLHLFSCQSSLSTIHYHQSHTCTVHTTLFLHGVLLFTRKLAIYFFKQPLLWKSLHHITLPSQWWLLKCSSGGLLATWMKQEASC